MNLADISIRRPTFITCIILVMLAVGYFFMTRLGVDLFPNVTFPVVTVTTPYLGAGPAEIETLVSKPLEDEISTISGIKRLSSINQEGVSVVVAEFTLETDVKFAEQQIRDRVGSAKRKLPLDIKEPVIRRIDPADQPILILALKADLDESKLYDVANEFIRPKLEQVNQVGLVEVVGGRKREIRVELDRNKLKAREIPASLVSARLAAAGEDVPVGKVNEGKREIVFRSLGQFSDLAAIEKTIVSFFGSDVPVTVKDLGKVTDGLVDEKSKAYVNGKRSLFIYVFKQSGSNTISVVKALKKRIEEINRNNQIAKGKPELTIVRNGSIWIDANVTDVKESIFTGAMLAVLVVFFFLANGRSTIITGLALPNSLIGAFILMTIAGFTINIMTLLALSLSVGLLIDDAIVVRENIFRHLEQGKTAKQAALEGTAEVRLAVIATTLTVIAVFGPVGFLKGVTGQFFKEFGLTICFAMMISLFDALTIAPMLSAYFAGSTHEHGKGVVGRMLASFDRFQTALENRYEKILRYSLDHPTKVLTMSFVVFFFSMATVRWVPKTFLPAQDAGEFAVSVDLPPGTNLDEMAKVALAIDEKIRSHPEVQVSALTVGSRDGDANQAEFYVHLVPAKARKMNTSQVKEVLRTELKDFAYANPKVKDYDAVGGGMRPFNVNIVGTDQKELERVALAAFEKVKKLPGLKDVDINFRPGKPEFQVAIDHHAADRLGISTVSVGQELRTQIEGSTPAKYREEGLEYDVRVRVREDQRNLKEAFDQIFVPNINGNIVRLSDVAKAVDANGPSRITRQDRARFVQIQADITPGAGLSEIMADVSKIITDDVKIDPSMRFYFVGQAENFQELGESMMLAITFGILFIFLVLSSLYESFVTPLTIMLALPLAMCGSFVGLLIARETINIFSMIGIIMLLGVATKNSILLVDQANQNVQKGMSRAQAMLESGKIRLRPILMTTMALIAGTIPIAIGLNEASRQRTSMGVAILGGLISSTLLTLVVIPAAYSHIDRFRIWSRDKMAKIFGATTSA